jgi:hypothetical protein
LPKQRRHARLGHHVDAVGHLTIAGLSGPFLVAGARGGELLQ